MGGTGSGARPRRGRGERGHNRAVADRAALATVVRDLVRALGGPQQQQQIAAECLGVSQPLLSQMATQKRGGVSDTTVARLYSAARQHLGASGVRALMAAVTSPFHLARAAARDDWIRERATRWLGRRGDRWGPQDRGKAGDDGHDVVVTKGPVELSNSFDFPGYPGLPALEDVYAATRLVEYQRRDDLAFLLSRLENRCPTAYEALVAIEARCRRLGLPSDRAVVAIVRALEPLLEKAEAGWEERGASDMTDRELEKFVLRALRNESELLRRSTGRSPD